MMKGVMLALLVLVAPCPAAADEASDKVLAVVAAGLQCEGAGVSATPNGTMLMKHNEGLGEVVKTG